MEGLKRVVLESPYASHSERLKGIYRDYLHRAMRDSLDRGEAPFASHAMYTLPNVLDDDIEEERKQGIEAGFAWGAVADLVVVYCDYGVSPGMNTGIGRARKAGQHIEYRKIWEDK